MLRWTLLFLVSLALSGCGRQVSIVEPNDAAADATSADTVTAPIEVATPSEPIVVPATIEQPAPTLDPPAVLVEPVVPEEPSAEPDPIVVEDPVTPADASEVTVILNRPSVLDATAGIGEITPVLQGSDGEIIQLACCDDQGNYTAVVPLNQQDQWQGRVLWQVSAGVDSVVVLEADVSVQGDTSDVVDITPDAYNLDTDTDGDGVSNITELVLGTNPNDITDASADYLAASVRIPRVPLNQVPVIDGRAGEYASNSTELVGEWANAVHADVNGNRLSVGNLMFAAIEFDVQSENHHWMAMHDGTWLYVLIIIDDAGQHHFDSQEVAKPWRDDGIELFVDGDNSQNPTYDQVDDFGMHITLLDTAEGGSNNSSTASPKVYAQVNSVPLPAGLVFATGPSQGPSAPVDYASSGVPQDVYEIAMRISDLNIELGRTFGFEIQFDDDDNGGDRDAKWGWRHPTGQNSDNDFTWRDPRYMGRVILMP